LQAALGYMPHEMVKKVVAYNRINTVWEIDFTQHHESSELQPKLTGEMLKCKSKSR